MGFDIIGDVHGRAEKLEALLHRLGYAVRNGAWRHPAGRTAIFVGDLVDRGPHQLRTLELVRAMIEAGSARAVMGNHEFNAIAWAMEDPTQPGLYLRPRHGEKGERNRAQHDAFLAEVGADPDTHQARADWFLDLPLWIEEPGFRVVHACWSPAHVERLRPGARATEALVEAAHRQGSPEWEAIDVLLKGPEVALPKGRSFRDQSGDVRREMRTRWWDPHAYTYRAAFIGPPGVVLPDRQIRGKRVAYAPDRPTFIGHYWMPKDAIPEPLSDKVACVDYSVGRGGPLVAYRYDGEPALSAGCFVAV
jgi:hypothetical protein